MKRLMFTEAQNSLSCGRLRRARRSARSAARRGSARDADELRRTWPSDPGGIGSVVNAVN